MRLNWMLAISFLVACSTPRPTLAHVRGLQSYPYELQVVDAEGRPMATYAHQGRTYVLGAMGARYQIRVKNHSGGRVEAVISVDGRDVVDGKPASLTKRGYIIMPYGEVTVDGFRISMGNVAAFRFASVRGSYAAKMGNAANVGVIGLAVFTEQAPPQVMVPTQVPKDEPYGSDRLREGDGIGGLGDSRSAEPSAKAEAAPAPTSASRGQNRGSGMDSEASGSADRMAKRSPSSRERPGLGTAFGETRYSPITETEFVRASMSADALLTLRYNDRAGLLALGIDVDGSLRMRDELRRREAANPFPEARFATPPVGWHGRN